MLADTYFCNFSVFQSMPDSWAVKQLFPIMPIHRLDEAPTRQAVLGDITCDSDGKVDQFIDLRDVKSTLSLHDMLPASRITSARFCSARIRKSSATCTTSSAIPTRCTSASTTMASSSLDEVIKGDTVREVLHYVQYSADGWQPRCGSKSRRRSERAKCRSSESRQFLRFYESGLDGYTYLEEP